jgi:hypothetical protein
MRESTVISQDEIARLQGVERLLRRILEEFRTCVARGCKAEPGPLSLNYSALYFPIPRLALDSSEQAHDLPPLPETVQGFSFEVLAHLLCEDEIRALRRQGYRKLAANKRRINRKLYRAFLDLYMESTFAVFTREVSLLFKTKDAKLGPVIGELVRIRYWTTVLRLLPVLHTFRIARPENIAIKALRKIDHIISPLGIVFSK